MTRPTPPRKRQRGGIDRLPSGAFRVRVYAGLDPLTGKRNYLRETIPPGRDARRETEEARTRLLSQVDERRNPRTRATMAQLLDRWLEVLDVEASTRQGYVRKLDKHVRPVLGKARLCTRRPTIRVGRRVRRACGARIRRGRPAPGNSPCDVYWQLK